MPKKAKNIVKYNVKDLVFARVRGYPPWPAQIVEVGLKYKVVFYGTGEIGHIKIEDLFNFEENREQFKNKFAKRRYYQEALNEITIAWNLKKNLEIPLTKDKSFSENKENDNSLGLTNVSSKHIKEEIQTNEDFKDDQETFEEKEEHEPIPGTSQNKDVNSSQQDGLSYSPKAKRAKIQRTKDIILSDSYLEDVTLKFERNSVMYSVYTIAQLNRIKTKHDEILNLSKSEKVNLDNCEIIDDHSVALVYDPFIHNVVFGLHITKHRPEMYMNAVTRLQWESKMVQDVRHIILDCRGQCRDIEEVLDDYFFELTDFEELLGTVKIIYETEQLNEFQSAAIKHELCILKIVWTIRELVPIEVKDENCLAKAFKLLRLIREKYMPGYITAMKHPVIVECFFKLTKYSCKQKLFNEEIVENIRTEANAIINDIRDEVRKHVNGSDFNHTFWKPYLACVKRFRNAVPNVCNYDFTALTTQAEYSQKLKDEKTVSQNKANDQSLKDSGEGI